MDPNQITTVKQAVTFLSNAFMQNEKQARNLPFLKQQSHVEDKDNEAINHLLRSVFIKNASLEKKEQLLIDVACDARAKTMAKLT